MRSVHEDVSRLVTRREAEPVLGYAPGSLKAAMTRQPGRWPVPNACRLQDRALLWDLDALRAASRTDVAERRTRRPSGADEDGLITCLTCGRRFRSLGPHLARIHRMTATDYRIEHQLPATTALMATDVRATLSRHRTEVMANDPELIARMHTAARPQQDLARQNSAEARAGTDDLPAVRISRRAAAQRTISAAQQARREALAEQVRAAGYTSVAAAIEATRNLSSRTAATRIGVSASTVKRRRQRL